MEEEKSCLFLPMWIVALGFLVLSFIGCSSVAHSPTQQNDLVFHACPENGHGDCPICCDPYKDRDEETITLDY